MGAYDVRSKSATNANTSSSSQALAPGKRALTDRLVIVQQHAGETVDQAGYRYAIEGDGTFVIQSVPARIANERIGKVGSPITPNNDAAWDRIARSLFARVDATAAAAPAAPVETPAPAPAPAQPAAAPEADSTSVLDVVTSPFRSMFDVARHLVAEAKDLVTSKPAAPVAAPAKPATKPLPPLESLPPARKAAAKALDPQGKAFTVNTKDIQPAGARKAPAGQSTHDIAASRLEVETTYRWFPGVYSPAEAKTQAANKATAATIAANQELIAKLKKTAGATDDEKAEAAQKIEDLTTANQALKDGLDAWAAAEQTHTETETTHQMSGDMGTTEFWCSGFIVWTLAAAGYNPHAQVLGADGIPFHYEFTDTKKVTHHGNVSLKALIDGGKQEVETMIKVEQTGQTDGATMVLLDYDGKDAGGHRDGYAADGTAATAVKGAAGALVLFGIGEAVPTGEQKPGDFGQSREATGGVQKGNGHAWQVYDVTASGSAMFGAPGSPQLVGGAAPATPTWLDGKTFLIDGKTNPALVGPCTLIQATQIEANVFGSHGTAADENKDGGVQTRTSDAAPAAPKSPADTQVFYGRLTESRWHGWTGATKESAEAAIGSAVR